MKARLYLGAVLPVVALYSRRLAATGALHGNGGRVIRCLWNSGGGPTAMWRWQCDGFWTEKSGGDSGGAAEVEIRFRDPTEVAGLFERARAWVYPRRGWWRIGCLREIYRVLTAFGRLTSGEGRTGTETDWRAEVLFRVAGGAASLLAQEDPALRALMQSLPRGRVRFEVAGCAIRFGVSLEEGPAIQVDWAEAGAVEEEANAVVRFSSVEAALAVLDRKASGPEAMALGWIRVAGNLPLAEGVDLVMDRVSVHLPRK